MKSQNEINWENKITKIHLEAYYLRVEGATRHIICRYMIFKCGPGKYQRGETRCNQCSTNYGKLSDRDCPCCGYQLRRHQRWKANSAPERIVRERREL